MPPIGPNEHPWTVMNEYTVDSGCQGVGYEGEDTASSTSSLTFGESSSTSEYVTTNETSSGKDGFISPTNANGLAYSVSPPHGAPTLHRNGREIRSQDTIGSYAGPRGGKESVPQSFDQTGIDQRYGSSPISIDSETRVPRTFRNFQGEDLIELFPHLSDGEPQAKVEEWVRRCGRYGAGLPDIDKSTGDTPVTEDPRGDNISRESNTQNGDSSEQHLSDLPDRSEMEHRQNQNQNGARKPKDGEASKEK
ncbi:hypothetical protein BKA61DRAFT_665817 [Leptodontidium sp. MPI-SDFR-AT-0119]|nr:hypothetical protein BKA61DRAFT_665817 [Leptodontidium sp. MPI-SDFR-AT-0119]